MADDLFQDLPPPSASGTQPSSQSLTNSTTNSDATQDSKAKEPPPPAPALKSALKRSRPPPQPQSEETEVGASEKRLRFKTISDTSQKQVIEAMQRIASHIKNPPKFSKASKLAIQLIQSGSVKPETSDYFFGILEAAMMPVTSCNEPSLQADYHALFSAAQDVTNFFNKKQQNLLTIWTIRAVLANDLFTDDSFVFSKATRKIKETISSLPVATEADDLEEAVTLKDESEMASEDGQAKQEPSTAGGNKEEPDPFGLDALIPRKSKKDEKAKDKMGRSRKEEEEENIQFLKSQREALISCLEIAARRYKTPWCQTAIDILAKHAYDNISRFTTRQRDAIEKLWNSIREQHMRRKQGKSVSGKLDVNAFEWLQQKYANEKISIRHSVGGSGDRRATQWLG